MTMRSRATLSVALAALGAETSLGQAPEPMFDLSREKVLYAVGYAHLDTQWRWDYPTTIDRFILDTLEQNFERFEDHPGYVFNFTGSVRYEMMREYYPEHYERLKEHIAAERWFVSGSSVDEGDANVPSAESMIRQVLYGNEFFRREFGKESADFMLPDCFGFPASMPSIWAHCGLLGFSTQKLTWGSAVGIPFEIGLWVGPDGKSVIAALDPGPYVGAIEGPVNTNPEWVRRVNENGASYGVWADYHYYGVGDMGGAPRDEDVANYLESVRDPDGDISVALVASDQMYKDITPELRENLPRYTGDLLLTEHSAGTLTSQSYMKRWNRMAEGLATSAERASVLADWLGALAYPRERLERAWVRVLASQMHDILPGTSIPEAYTFSWNDEVVAMNMFAAMLTDAAGAVARVLDTQTEGRPLLVYNPLAIERSDLVEATLAFDDGAPRFVRVFGPDGEEAPSQVLEWAEDSVTMLFAATAPANGFVVYEVRAADAPFTGDGALRITERTLENESLRIEIDDAGDVTSIMDKSLGREILASPAQLQFTYEKPRQWPAWNMDWADRQRPPLGVVDGPATIRIVEDGPVRVVLEVMREARNSVFTQRITLAQGDAGRIVEFDTFIDWQSTEVALKAAFPLTASNPEATYNWGLGTIERGNNEPVKYEVPSHEWIELTDASGAFGVSILEDSKFGSDKPADNEIRLTLLYTPGVRTGYLDQHSQDWGRHEMRYAVYPHAGDWRDGCTEWRGRRLNQPLRAFAVPRHAGAHRRVSLASLNTEQVDIRAIKGAEAGNATIVRLQELWGRNAEDVRIAMIAPIIDAWEVDGQERRIGPARVIDGALALDMTPYSPRSFAVRLAPPAETLAGPSSAPIDLPWNLDVISADDDRTDGRFDDLGRTFPSEMLPASLTVGGVQFQTGARDAGALNAVATIGQTIQLPAGDFTHVSVLAAATEDVEAIFRAAASEHETTIQSWTGFVGQWDDRLWDREFAEIDYTCEGQVTGFLPGFIKRDEIAWFATHRHHPGNGNEAYQFSYLFKHDIPIAPGARTLTLPDDSRIRIFAATATHNPSAMAEPAGPLYDTLEAHGPLALRHVYPPPPTPVFEGVEPTAAVAIERAESIDALALAQPSSSDAANSATVRYIDPDREWTPHWGAGAVDGELPRLTDGLVARNDDDTGRCVWWDGSGRFVLDLGQRAPVDSIRVFSWHRSDRAPQHFSVWASDAEVAPDGAFEAGGHDGWTLLGVVDTHELGQGGVHASVVRPFEQPIGGYRHLLFIAEDMAQGTFFMEVDVALRE